MNKTLRIFLLYVSLYVFTTGDKYFRLLFSLINFNRMLNRLFSIGICNEYEIDQWIASFGWTNQTNPADIGNVVRLQFKWREDKSFRDYAKCPGAFFANKGVGLNPPQEGIGADDCDGFAMFCEYVFNKLGYEDVSRLYVRTGDSGHAICVVKHQDRYFEIGNWPPLILEGKTTKEHAKQIANAMGGDMSCAMKFKGYSLQEYIE